MSHLDANADIPLDHSSGRPSEKGTLTDVDVAARLGVSRFTVRSWRIKGVGPRFMKMGRAVRYRPQDVDEYERQALVETRA
jgi:excisionase family DNA binding protein